MDNRARRDGLNWKGSFVLQMLNANRAYEANASVIKAAKDMALKALEIGR